VASAGFVAGTPIPRASAAKSIGGVEMSSTPSARGPRDRQLVDEMVRERRARFCRTRTPRSRGTRCGAPDRTERVASGVASVLGNRATPDACTRNDPGSSAAAPRGRRHRQGRGPGRAAAARTPRRHAHLAAEIRRDAPLGSETQTSATGSSPSTTTTAA
jgi:hypothetical protein